jgi:tetratricopeptide (TPR) repeat protein
MSVTDQLGLYVTGADAAALGQYEKALHELQCYVGDPVASVDAALGEAPELVMGHVLKGYLFGLSTDREAVDVVKSCHAAATGLPATVREKGHVAALGHLAAGRWHEAGRVLEDVTIEEPRDALALLAGHQIDFFTGNSRMLRDRIARAVPAWSPGMAGYHAMLSMHAFGLEEMGDYARAERLGREAIGIEPRDGWAQHAVAHVMEMQSRQRDGIAWMRDNAEAWTGDSFFQVHNWWHLALFHYELGDTDAALKLFDDHIYGTHSTLALNMLDASALLWRLHLQGVDVGDRWAALAANWAPKAKDGNYAFNDAHAMMAFVGAGLDEPARLLLEAQDEAMGGTDDNAHFTREVGHPVTRAIKAFGEGDYATVVTLLRPIRGIAARFGGSHAQRDVIDLTLIEAAFRSGNGALAAALSAERAVARPESPLSQLFLRRAREVAGRAVS